MQGSSVCPICWATALATFGGLLAVSVLTIAATDIWTLAAATMLATTSFVHRTQIEQVPWWVFATLTSFAIGRVVYLLAYNRDRLLVVKAWGHACQIAARRCPKRKA
jgi:hypothetical protein